MAPALSPTASTSVLTLTMWTTEVFNPLQDDLSSQILKKQITGFVAENPRLAVDFVLKKAYGKGGISDFLQTTGAVVPQALPDLAIIDSAELPDVARAGLVRPLGDLIEPQIQEDLFPFAVKAGTVDNQLVGLLFECDVLHLAYNSRQVTAPLNWGEVFSNTGQYVFPAGGDEQERISADFWLQYLAAGGELPDSPDKPTLDAAMVERVFSFYADALTKGVVPRTVLDYGTEADSWLAFLSGKAAMTNVSSLRYLSARSTSDDMGFAPVPTPDGRPFTVANGWALVVLAKDQARQQAAARLVDWLLQPEHSGKWTRATNRLSTTRRALATWGQADPYVAFVRSLLEVAQPCPAGSRYDALSKALQRSLRDVLTGSASPKEAAAAAVSEE